MAIFRGSQGTNSFRKQKQMEKTSIYPAFPVGTIFMACETSMHCLSAPSPRVFVLRCDTGTGSCKHSSCCHLEQCGQRMLEGRCRRKEFLSGSSVLSCLFLWYTTLKSVEDTAVSFSCTPNLHIQLSIVLSAPQFPACQPQPSALQ